MTSALVRSGLKFLMLMGFWIVLSGKFDPFHIGLGVLSAFLVIFLGFQKPPSAFPRQKFRFFSFLAYLPWLFGRIVVSSFHVAKLVLNPKLPINPKWVHFRTRLERDAAKALLANSITLTPGTVTGECGDEFVVHALDDESASDVVSGVLETKVNSVFRPHANGGQS